MNNIDNNNKCSCGGNIVIIYFKDKKGTIKPDYAVCDGCLKSFTVSD